MSYALAVSPYRSPTTLLEKHEVGSRRAFRIQVAVGVALLCISALLSAFFRLTGGGIDGSIFLPALFGGIMIARVRHSSIEVSPNEREVRVSIRRFGPALRVRIPFGELESVRVRPTSVKSRSPTYELQIGRAGGEPVVLMRADGPRLIEVERERLWQVLSEAGAMSGPRTRAFEPDPHQLPRIELASEVTPAAEPEEPADELDDRPRFRRG